MARVDIASSAEVKENASLAAKAEGIKLLLTRVAGKVHAIENKCPHLNLSMTRGKVEGATVHCPWHGSTFDVCTGQNLDWITSVAGIGVPEWSRSLIAFGKRPAGIRTFPAFEENGRVFVEV